MSEVTGRRGVAEPAPRAGPVVALASAMVAAVVAVAALATWDARREAAASLEDFADAQTSLAVAMSAELEARLAAGDPRPTIHPSSSADRGRRVSLVFPPGGGDRARTVDGEYLSAPGLAAALREGRTTVRLTREESAAIGLPERMSMAGLARVGGPRGQWGVAVVSSAASERDREIRAGYRLALSVGLAAGLVFALGVVALRRQRKELELERELSLAQQRARLDERLERAARAATMGTFAMGIAHEISTPLGVISGRAEQLSSRVADPRDLRGVEAIREQAAHIGRIVRGFLDLARGEAPPFARVAPAEVVDGALRLVEHRLAAGKTTLSRDLEADLPAVRCDVRLVEHALVNLLLNAVHAISGFGKITIAARRQGEVVAFEVIDDGVGITPADAARATEPFFTTKAASDGTGLGLAIAREIAEAHRGTLTIAPHSPRGTRACLTIPVHPESSPDEAA